jgi:hypothetical protein
MVHAGGSELVLDAHAVMGIGFRSHFSLVPTSRHRKQSTV